MRLNVDMKYKKQRSSKLSGYQVLEELMQDQKKACSVDSSTEVYYY